jgi:hypothetical protein
VPNLKLRHKHRAAHPDIDPSSVPSLPLSLHALSVQTHTRFKLKFEIEIEPEPMELPECKAGSDWQVQNREQKEGEKEELKCVRAGMCRGGEQKSQLCVQRHWCQPEQTRRWARRAEACAEQLKARSARTQPVGSSMVLRRQTRCGPV